LHQALTTQNRIISRTATQLTEEFNNEVTKHIESKKQDRLLRIWRSEHHGNTYWMTGYSKATKDNKVTLETSHTGQRLHNNSSSNCYDDEESGDIDNAGANSTTLSDREQHHIHNKARRFTTPDTIKIRMTKDTSRHTSTDEIHTTQTQTSTTNYKTNHCHTRTFEEGHNTCAAKYTHESNR